MIPEIIFTIINAGFTLASVACAVIAINQTRKQTNIMQQQLEESQKPNFPLTMRLESIANQLHQISESILHSKPNK